MKNKKWITYTLGTLLTLIALAVVGLAGFRIGLAQNITFPRMDRTERPSINQNTDQNLPTNPNGDGPRGSNFSPRGFDRGHRGMPMTSSLFGWIKFAVLALLLWTGYKLASNNGWKLVRVQNEAPAAANSVVAEPGEEKESE